MVNGKLRILAFHSESNKILVADIDPKETKRISGKNDFLSYKNINNEEVFEGLNTKENVKSISNIEISSDGQLAAMHYGEKKDSMFLGVWDLTTGKRLFNLQSFNTDLDSLHISPDNKYVVTTSCYNDKAIIYNIAAAEQATKQQQNNQEQDRKRKQERLHNLLN